MYQFSIKTPSGDVKIDFSRYTAKKGRSIGFFGWMFESDADVINNEVIEKNAAFAHKVKRAMEESSIGEVVGIEDILGKELAVRFLEGEPIKKKYCGKLAHDLHEFASLQARLRACSKLDRKADDLTFARMRKLWFAFEQDCLALNRQHRLMEEHVMAELKGMGYPEDAFSEGVQSKLVDPNLVESDWRPLSLRIFREAQEFVLRQRTLERGEAFRKVDADEYLKHRPRWFSGILFSSEKRKEVIRDEFKRLFSAMDEAGMSEGLLSMKLQEAIELARASGVPLRAGYRKALRREFLDLVRRSSAFLKLAKSDRLKAILVKNYPTRKELVEALGTLGYLDIVRLDKAHPLTLYFSTSGGVRKFDLRRADLDLGALQWELNHYCLISAFLHS